MLRSIVIASYILFSSIVVYAYIRSLEPTDLSKHKEIGPAPFVAYPIKSNPEKSLLPDPKRLKEAMPVPLASPKKKSNIFFQTQTQQLDQDWDNDLIPNAYDNDQDNDGITDNYDLDSDNDGVIDFIDFDLDNDGIPYFFDADSDNDGILDSQDKDLDNDGINDFI